MIKKLNRRLKRGQYSPTLRRNELGRKHCAMCKIEFPLSNFFVYRDKGYVYPRSYCKACENAYTSSFPQQRKTLEQRQRNNAWTKQRRLEALTEGLCGSCHDKPVVPGKKYCQDCQARDSRKAKIYNTRNRKIVFDHYGRKCTCPNCDVTNEAFLTLDHIGGWGKDHRTPAGYRMGGVQLYRWLIRNEFPEGFRVLCFNCNCSAGHTGYCGHEVEHKVVQINEGE